MKVDAIVHQTSCIAPYSTAGVAREIAQQLPFGCVYSQRAQQQRTGQDPRVIPGSISVCCSDDINNLPCVIGLNAQVKPGAASSFERRSLGSVCDDSTQRLQWFIEALEGVAALPERPRSIAVPHGIGCGSSGGAWPLYKAALANFASRHTDIAVHVVQRSDEFIARMQQRGMRCNDKARALARSWKDPMQRAVGLSMIDCLEATLLQNADKMNSPEDENSTSAGSASTSSSAAEQSANTADVGSTDALDQEKQERELRGLFTMLCQHIPADQVASACSFNSRRVERSRRTAEAAAAASGRDPSLSGTSEQTPLLRKFSTDVQHDLDAAKRQVDLENDAIDEAYRAHLVAQVSAGIISHDGIVESFAAIGQLASAAKTESNRFVSLSLTGSAPSPASTGPTSARDEDGESTRSTSDAFTGFSVSSSQGRRTPCRLVSDAHMVDKGGLLQEIKNNIWDGGSAITLLGEADFRQYERLGCASKGVKLPTSCEQINGIGAANMVLYYARFTVDLGGARIEFLDVPVLANFRGLLFGNDVIYHFQQDQRIRKGLPGCDGYVVLHDEQLKPVSREIPISVSPDRSARFPVFGGAASTPPDEQQ